MNSLFPAADPAAPTSPATAILAAARLLLPDLERGARIDAAILRAAMETAFGASDAAGVWDWKSAYEACEVATVLFLRKYGAALFRRAVSMDARLAQITKIAALLPSQTRRSEDSQSFQQFSTPLPLGLAALAAARITHEDVVLEPSAGTGLMAILAETLGGGLILNELADTRADLLSALFPAAIPSRFDAAQINDHLDAGLVPSVVVMNPPFSALAHVAGRNTEAAFRHIASALARLAPGGRLVAITGAGFGPEAPAWQDAFIRLQASGRVVFSAAVDGSVYARHGTTTETRLTVIDKQPAEDPAAFPASPGVAPDVQTLLGWIAAHVPGRLPVSLPQVTAPVGRSLSPPVLGALGRPVRSALPVPTQGRDPEAVELAYDVLDWTPPEGGRLSDAIYEPYALQAIRIPGAEPHPTRLVQSAAMASVAPPPPTYRPLLPSHIRTRLSEAQLETVIYTGEAHSSLSLIHI